MKINHIEQKHRNRLFRIIMTEKNKSGTLNTKITYLSNITTNVSKKLKKGKILSLWNEFCDVTSVVGLRHIGGQRPAKHCCWWIWVIVWLSQFMLCAWLSSKLFAIYLKYDVKSSSTYYTTEELPFPAITFCNQNGIRRTIVGGNIPVMELLSSLSAKNVKEIDDMMYENNRTCYSKPNSKLADLISKVTTGTLMEFMSLLSMDSVLNVEKCWWSNKEINCTGLFLNHLTDYSFCFTFNADVQKTSNLDVKNADKIADGYGLDMDRYGVRNILNAGPKTGLRLMLNVHQEEYCGSANKYHGAGFYIQIHDPAVQPSFQLSNSIWLGPGYYYDISLKPVIFERKTGHLGKCLKSLRLSAFPNAKKYFLLECYMQHIFVAVWKTCKCFLGFRTDKQDDSAEIFYNELGVKKEDIVLCQGNEMICAHSCIENALNDQIKLSFPGCKVPCVETLYESEMSTKRFPSREYAGEAFTNASAAKNLLQVNFNFNSMTKLVVLESQAVSEGALAIAFGWTMNLFLGSSFITPFEVFLYIWLTFHEWLKRIHRRARIRKLQKQVSVLF